MLKHNLCIKGWMWATVLSASCAFFVANALGQSGNCETCTWYDEEIVASGDKWVYQPDWGDCEEPGSSQLVCFTESNPTTITVDIYSPDGNGGWNWQDRTTIDHHQCYHNDTMCW